MNRSAFGAFFGGVFSSSAGAAATTADRRADPGARLRRPAFLLALLLAGLIGAPQALEGDAGAAPLVWVVDFDGPLGPANGDLIARSIDGAAAAGASAIVIRMDTPGGLDKTMRELIKKILAAPLPVITYVAPSGARAASAGTYISYASHLAAMAPATNIGSSTPVSLAPQPGIAEPPGQGRDAPGEDGGEGGADDAVAKPSTGTDAMARKVINDAVAYLQGLAELRGRNIEWAEETVREGANLRASEALEKNVIDLVSPDLPALLEAIDGREVQLATGSTTLKTAGARLHEVQTDWKHDLLEIITDPAIAYGLLIFGVYGLILEFYSPGMVFPSVVGIVCILLGAYGLQMLPVNYAGLALIVVGIGMMVAELFTPTMGVLGVAGLAAFVFGSLILMDTQAPGYALPLSLIAAFALATGGLVVLALGAAVRARGEPAHSGVEAMVGGPARALEDFASSGRVHAFGEDWQARTEQPVASGDALEVRAVDGLVLLVGPAAQDDQHNTTGAPRGAGES